MNRENTGSIVSGVGIALNICLAAAKLTVGFLFGLVSVAADGFNNLSDCGSGIVSVISFRVSKKPADREHPYGHHRMEYIASMAVAFFILALAVELFRESLERVLTGATAEGNLVVYVLLGVAVGVKAAMFAVYRIFGKKLKSDVLRAAAIDSAADCVASSVVLLGVALAGVVSFPVEGYAGLLVALFIAFEGIVVLREAGSKLLGVPPEKELVARVKELLSAEGIVGFHDLKFYSYGREKSFATVHLETDASLSQTAAHEAIDGVETRVFKETGVQLTAHADPVDLSDCELKEAEERVRGGLEGLVDGLEVHDFRLVRGAVTKLVFEVGVPFSCEKTDGEIEEEIVRFTKMLTGFEPVVTVERE